MTETTRCQNEETSILVTDKDAAAAATMTTPLATLKVSKKRVVAAFVALSCAAAMVGVVTRQAMPRTEPMNLQLIRPSVAAYTDLQNGIPMIFNAIVTGALCMEFGSMTGPSSMAMRLERCDLASPRQAFFISRPDKLVRAAFSPSLCWATTPDDGTLHLTRCDPSSAAQRFTFDQSTLMVRQADSNQCFTTMGGSETLSNTPIKLKTCDPASITQKFSFGARGSGSAPAPPPPPTLAESSFMLLDRTNRQCVDTRIVPGTTLTSCSLVPPLTIRWNPVTQAMTAMAQTCVDVADMTQPINRCTRGMPTQTFMFDPSAKMFRCRANPEINLCPVKMFGPTTGILAWCDRWGKVF